MATLERLHNSWTTRIHRRIGLALATELPQVWKVQFREWRVSADYGGLLCCGNSGPAGPICFHIIQLTD